jgi:rsbT co-antagonist protein RsbR
LTNSDLSAILRNNESSLLIAWLSEQKSTRTRSVVSEAELQQQSREFLQLFQQAVTESGEGNRGDIEISAYRAVRRFLEEVTASRTLQGATPSETARFIFSFKTPLFAEIRSKIPDPVEQVEAISDVTALIDNLGLFITEAHQKAREGVILRQQEEMLELSTPVVKLWDGVLALPIIGTLDSSRTQTIMESLLERIVETGSEIAIIDITGVPTVDTLTAQHLLKTVTAARLMGAECIISGIRPQIAQTIVHLGVELGDVITKASLADAFRIALQRSNYAIVKRTSTQPAQRA